MESGNSLTLLEGLYHVCKLPADSQVPPLQGEFFSVTRTDDELSIVVREEFSPKEAEKETDWRVFKVQGPLDFSLTGIMSRLTAPLAKASISVFAISTFDTDYILVKNENVNKSREVLEEAGFSIQ